MKKLHLIWLSLTWLLFIGQIGLAYADTPSPDTTYVQAETAAFLEKQTAIRNELREGLNRLQSVCKKKPQGGTVNLSELQLDTAQRLAQNKQRATDAERLAETGIKRYLEEVKRRRNERCNPLSGLFKEKGDRGSSPNACQIAMAEQKAAESLASWFTEYQNVSRARFALFEELIQTEARGCARPGFTERMLGIYELNNLSTELGIADYFARTADKIRNLHQAAAEAK